jgi:hypothetical protein
MAEDGGLSQLPNGLAKALADFDRVSAFTWLAIAIAGAVILQLPSPTIRSDWYGPAIAGITILAFLLWIAKTARALHAIIADSRKPSERGGN